MGSEAIQAIVEGLASNEALVAAIADRVSARTSRTGMGSSTMPQLLPPAALDANITLQDTAMTSQPLVASGSSSTGSDTNTSTTNSQSVITSTGMERQTTNSLRGKTLPKPKLESSVVYLRDKLHKPLTISPSLGEG